MAASVSFSISLLTPVSGRRTPTVVNFLKLLLTGVILTGALALACPRAAGAAAPPEAEAEVLGVLTKLGLPDTRGAKWVQASLPSDYAPTSYLSGRSRGSVQGNAWLLAEEKGMVTLIVEQTRTIRARLASEEEVAKERWSYHEEALAAVAPADLQADLAAIKKELEQGAGAIRPDESDDDHYAKVRGQVLLLLAHLAARGQPEGQALLAKVRAAGPPQNALNAAITCLAEARLEALNEEWVKTGHAVPYAAALEALAAEFHRGWKNREAVLMLAQRVRASKGAAELPGAQIMLGWRSADYELLPLGGNWMLPEPASRDVSSASTSRVRDGVGYRATPRAQPGVPPTPLEAFFAQPMKVAQVLLPLLGSHQPLRIVSNQRDTRHRFQYSVRFPPTPEQAVEEAYWKLSRPLEMGELAEQLLQGILPKEEDRTRGTATLLDLQPMIASWVHALEGKSADEIAWIYLSGAEGSADENFFAAITFLAEHGSAESAHQLREVILDPAIWQDYVVPGLAAPLRALLAKAGAEREKLAAEVLKVARAALIEQPEKRQEEFSHPATARRQTARRASAFQQLRQVVQPRSVTLLLQDFVAANEMDAAALMAALRMAGQENPSDALPGQILSAAATASTATHRKLLLDLFMYDADEPPLYEAIPPTREPAIQSALRKLLADEALPPEDPDDWQPRWVPVTSIALQTAYGLVMPKVEGEIGRRYNELRDRAPFERDQWVRSAAAALVEGAPIPPVPSGPDLSDEEIAKLEAGWMEWSGAQVLAAVRALPPATQVGLAAWMKTHAAWGKSLTRAQMTIGQVHLPAGEQLPELAALSGRAFDEKLRSELDEVLRQAAAKGRFLRVSLSAAGPLSALTLVAEVRHQPVTGEEFDEFLLPGLAKLPPPESYLSTSVRSESSEIAGAIYPQWKDQALTDTWVRNHDPEAKELRPGMDSTKRSLFHDPPGFANQLARLDQGDPEWLGMFEYVCYLAPIGPRPR